MSESLREQLLRAGLVDQKRADQAGREANRERYRQGKGKPAVADPAEIAAKQAAAAKAARDQTLNREREERARLKARQAQIRQLIDENRLPGVDSDEYFNFVDGGRVRRVAATRELRDRILRGQVSIARRAGSYVLVPTEAAARIRERDERAIVPLQSADSAPAADDPYRDFAVPDDLMW